MNVTHHDVIDYLVLVLCSLPIWMVCYAYGAPIYISFPAVIALMAGAFVRGRWA
jgi:hypothetical protein